MNTKNVIRLALIAALAAGLLTRVFGGLPVFSSAMVYSSGKKEPYPGVRTPEALVKSFYMYIDNGLFSKAWETVREPLWLPEEARVVYADNVRPGGRIYGFTSLEQFGRRGTAELGYGGSWVRLQNIKTRVISVNDTGEGLPAAGLPAAELPAELLGSLAADSYTSVSVSGHMIGACTIFSWKKDVLVAEKNGGYFLVLPGTKEPKSFYYQSWFDNIEKIASLRSTTP